MEELPEDAREYNPSIMRIRPTIHEEDDLPSGQQIAESSGRGGQAESSELMKDLKRGNMMALYRSCFPAAFSFD